MRYHIVVRNGNKKVASYKYSDKEYDQAMDTLDWLTETYPEYSIDFRDKKPF